MSPSTAAAAFGDREIMPYDATIVGAGPAGLAAAIELRRQAKALGCDFSVAVLEKGAEVGSHILSGAVIDPTALSRLIPDWKERGAPLTVPVVSEDFLILGPGGDLRIPSVLLPPLMRNHGCYAAGLGSLTRWLAGQAEEAGVDIFPGFAAAELIHDDKGAVVGVATGDLGRDRNGEPKAGFSPGVALSSAYVVLAEGARGSLAKQAIGRFGLDKNADPPKFGIGFKELWEIPEALHRPGHIIHSLGWPLDRRTGGGGFLYHLDKRRVAVGFVVHLSYRNPYLSPFDEFQRFKTHPAIRPVLEGGRRLAYGARAVTEGGFQSVPQLAFPGGVLIGCAAGFVNVARIKGSHNAVESGRLAAQSIAQALKDKRPHRRLTGWDESYRNSAIAAELQKVRNVKPIWERFGTVFGLPLIGLELWGQTLFPWLLRHTLRLRKPDHQCLESVDRHRPIAYPKPDGIVSFDRPSSVHLSGVNHEADQPVHLRLADPDIPVRRNLPVYQEPAQRYCPAGVYEIDDGDGEPRFVINAQNCVHCKTCDIKDPANNITWIPPEGGGGPNYPDM